MDANTVTLILGGALISTAIAFWVAWSYLERTKPKRIRKAQEGNVLDSKDEAHNSVVSTKSIINVMKKKGVDVGSSEIIIERAEIALDAGNYKKAKRLAEEAKDDLDNAKTRPQPAMPVLKKVGKEDIEYESDVLDDLVKLEEELSEEDRSKQQEFVEEKEKIRVLPDNYLESKFEIDVAKQLVQERGTHESIKLLQMAESHFENEDYTGALKYAMKTKKSIDEKEAGLLAAQKVDRVKPESISKGEVKTSPTSYEIETREEAFSCPECGNPVDVSDKFCNLCGGKLEFKSNCPECGVEVSPLHRFCANCGTDLKSTAYECPECGTEIDADSKFCPACGIGFED